MKASIVLIIVLVVNILIIALHFIYITPAIELRKLPLPVGHDQDIAALKALEDQVARGWAQGEAALMADAFTEDADYVTFMGQWLKGKEEIRDAHQQLFDGPLKGSTLVGRTIHSIEFTNDSTALLHISGSVKPKWRKQAAKSRLSIQTLVAIKQQNVWKFKAFHNARVSRISLWDVLTMDLK